jgi:hypothetical protein
MGFNDFSFQEADNPNQTNYLKIPQNPVKIYDCIKNEEIDVKPPDIKIEGFSKY